MSIILKNLLLGSKENASDIVFLKTHNITTVINITNDIDNYFEKDIKYINIKIEDSIDENLLNILDKYTNIINSELQNNNVFIHCNRGKSRSASFVIAYLLKFNNMNLYEAFNFVKNKRDISPNIHFFKQLSDYEYKISNNRTFTVWEYMNKTEDEYKKFIEYFHK